MPDSPLLNYTTEIPASRTVGQIQDVLAQAGASEIAVSYDGDRHPRGIRFEVETPKGRRAFTLPAEVDKILAVMQRAYDSGERWAKRGGRPDRAQARRTGWRILLDWTRAQLAIIRTEMVTLDQVMLPYMHIEGPDSPTVYELAQERFAALPPARVQ
jgi:hypothetical protein